MNMQLTLATRYLGGRKLRTFLTTLAIVFGVLVVFGMNAILPAFTRAFMANTMAAAGQVDAAITLRTGDVFDATVAESVAGVDGVRAISGQLERTVNLPPDYYDNDPARPDGATALAIIGLEVDQATAVRSYVPTSGRFLQEGDTDAAVISENLSDAIGVGLGDTMAVPTPRGQADLTVVGILPPNTQTGNERVLVSLPQAQALLNMPGQINTIEVNFDSLDDARRAAIEQAIVAELGDAYQVGALAANSELLTNLRLAQTILNVLGLLALLMGGFIILNTFRTVVVEQRRDLGMLRTLGASRRTVFGVVLSEGLIQGLVGTAVGLLLGYLLGMLALRALNPILQRFMNVRAGSPEVSFGLVAGSVAIGVGVTLLAGLLPALSASRVSPLEALRPPVGTLSMRRLTGVAFWAGVTMIVLSVLALITKNTALLGLGSVLFVAGLILVAPALVTPIARVFSSLLAAVFARSGTAQLAESNLSRQPSRAAITASTTLIGIAILIMAASMLSSLVLGFGNVIRKSLGSDFILVPPSVGVWGTNIGAGPGLAEELAAIEGVETVSALRFAPTQVNGTSVAVLGIDPATYPQVSGLSFSEGEDAAAYAAIGAGRNLIASPVLASTLGIGVGDTVEMLTPGGPVSYAVVAIGGDYLNAKVATAYLSHDNIAADFGRNEDVLLQLNLAPGADEAAAEAQIKAIKQDYPQFRLLNGREYIEENLRLLDTAFAAIFGLVIFLAIPSVIAMVNTLAIGVIERTREIGMLRAVGATRGQVRRIVLAEALILSALGTAFGILAGLYLGYMVVEALRVGGFPLEYVFPTTGVLLAIVAGIIFGVLAALIPARQASHLQIVEALRYE